VIDSGLVGSTEFDSSHSPRHEPEHHGRGAARAEDAQGIATRGHTSPSILVYEEILVTKIVSTKTFFKRNPGRGGCADPVHLQGYLGHKKQCPPRTLQKEYAQGLMVALEGSCDFL